MRQVGHKVKKTLEWLPAIKPHLDLLAGILTIPVLLTVIILNFSNLSKENKPATPAPSAINSTQPVTVVQIHPTNVPVVSSATCQPTIGPLSITYPAEGQTVSNNPLCITIDYQSEGYCAVVWAYKINNGPLSDYSNNSVCLYNMAAGKVSFELDVKSLVSSQTKTYTRNFIYQPSTTPTPTSTSAPTLTPTITPTPSNS